MHKGLSSSSASRSEVGGGLDDQLCFALYAATNALTRAYRPFLAALGLTYPQYLVMLTLWEEARTTSGQLARRLDLAPNAITPILDRLEGAGLIERRRDEGDRRRVHVTATGEGEALQARIAEVQHAVGCRTGLDATEIASLRERLHALARCMSEEGGAPGR